MYRNHLEKKKLAKIIEATRFALHETNTSVSPWRYHLQSAGILATANGEAYWQRLIALFTYLRDQFYVREDNQLVVTQAEIEEALKLTPKEADELGRIGFGGFLGLNPNWNPDPTKWQLYMPTHVVEDFPRCGSVESEVEKLLDERLSQLRRSRETQAASRSLPTQDMFAGVELESGKNVPRRYQVFVSSTFNDLEDERLQVMHALLEMQCFPAGMELFPATDGTPWDRIQDEIDESDYYIVITAGRYGSLIPKGKISFTEREFRYARKKGIPILAFVHESPGKILAEKTESGDVGKAELKRFVGELKKVRLCKLWSNGHDLGSAVKTALQQAFKKTPRPGWVRAE